MRIIEYIRKPFESVFLQHVSMMGVSTGSTLLIGMINMIIVARYLSMEALGVFIIMEIIVEFLAVVSHAGMDVALTQVLATSNDNDKPLISSTALIFRGLTLLAIFAFFIPAKSFFFMLSGGEDIQVGGLAIFCLLLVFGYRTLLRFILEGYFCFKSIMKIDIVISLVNLSVVIVSVVLLEMNLEGVIYARVLSSFVGCCFFYLAIPGKKVFIFRMKHLMKVLKVGLPLQLNDIIQFFTGRLASIVVASMLGPASLATLEIARKIPTLCRRFYQSFRSVYLPSFSKLFANKAAGQQASLLMNRSLLIIMSLSGVVAVFGSFFAEEIITLLFSEKYVSGTAVFILSMVSVQIGIAGNILGTSLVAMGETKSATVVNVVGSVFSLPLNFIIIPLLGVIGAPIVQTLGSCFGVFGNGLFLRKRLVEIQLASFFPACVTIIFCLSALCFLPDIWWYRLLFCLVHFVCMALLYVLIVKRKVALPWLEDREEIM